jgi:nitrite reductase (cytochrome c-552)
LGYGDAEAGMNEAYKYSYQDLNKKLHDMGHGHAVACIDCHNPQTLALRVTRPPFLKALRDLAASDAPVPVLCHPLQSGVKDHAQRRTILM